MLEDAADGLNFIRWASEEQGRLDEKVAGGADCGSQVCAMTNMNCDLRDWYAHGGGEIRSGELALLG